jgi:anti-sigma regulatory factor (Ser/Thr protein kinase)
MATSTAIRSHTVRHRSRSPHLPSGLPSRAVIDLDTQATAPGRARAWIRQVLPEWQVAGLLEAAEVVVSELVTNAMLVSRRLDRPSVRLILTLDQGELTVFVRDYCPGSPQPRDVGDEEENGRGLFLVEAMSSRFGWYPSGDGAPGKVVWAALAR